MYKLYIVDDEEIVIDGMTTVIDWAEHNIEVVGWATDGICALEQILEKKPDIVIVDIRMPGISGLELIEKVRDVCTDIVFIIFSGYNDFEYAKKAIKLGAIDYLIKPVEIIELLGAVEKAIEKRNILKKMNESQTGERDELIREKKIFKLLFLGEPDTSDLDIIDSIIVSTRIGSLENKFGKLERIINSALKESSQCSTLLFYEEEFVIIFENLRDGQESSLTELLSSISIKASDELSQSLTFGIGKKSADANGLCESYLQSREACRYALYIGQIIAFYQDIDYNKSYDEEIDYNKIADNIFSSDNFDYTINCISEFVDRCLKNRQPLDILVKTCVDLIYFVLYKLDTIYGVSSENIFEKNFSLSKSFDLVCSSSDVELKTIETLKVIRNFLNSNKIDYKEKVILSIRNYVNQNIDKIITLNDLSEKVHISPAYLSNFYKHKTGVPILQYITCMKMEKAKNLLINSFYKISEISSMVGYDDQRYFSKVFKKHTGLTAKEYRNKYSVNNKSE